MHRQLLVGALAASAAFAQSPELPKPIWTAAESFSAINSVRELANGRVILVDTRESRVVMLDAKGVLIADIGRAGAGPDEYQQPVRLIALPHDSTLLIDQGLRRFLVIDPSGKPVSTFVFPPDAGSVLIFARAADANGRIITQSDGISRRTDGIAGDGAILAWDRATGTRDTLAIFKLPPSRSMDVSFPGGGRGTSTYVIRYAPADEWAYLSTGEVALLKPEPYHLEIVPKSGSHRVGKAVAYAKAKVAESERVPKQIADQIPEYKPAFARGGPGVPGVRGDLWVRRLAVLDAPRLTWDVFDGNANQVQTYVLDKDLAVVGFGRAAMYTVRTDGDGLQWLEKRPLPR